MDNQLFLLLVTRKLSGEATERDIEELEKFFKEDDLYKQKFGLFKNHWENKNSVGTDTDLAFRKIISEINSGNDNDLKEVIPVFELPVKKNFLRLVKLFSKVAAVLFAFAAIGYFIYQNTKAKHQPGIIARHEWTIKQNPRGAKSVIMLPDNTRVVLNADSKLQFPSSFTGNTREVYLTGEAFFDVTHNAAMPFIIHTSKMNIKVLGTEFNVKSYPEDSTSETTLIRGLIEVTLKDRPSDKIILRPKEKLIVSNEPETAEKNISTVQGLSPAREARLLISSLHYVSPKDSAIVETSWLDNKLIFQDESFAQLATDIERRYGINIQFSNEQVKEYRFTGVFEKETIDEILKALKLTEKFNYKIEGKNITIY